MKVFAGPKKAKTPEVETFLTLEQNGTSVWLVAETGKKSSVLAVINEEGISLIGFTCHSHGFPLGPNDTIKLL